MLLLPLAKNTLHTTLQEHYSQLTNKTRTFFKSVDAQYNADWVLKMDDDVYLNPTRLLAAVAQWERMDAQYVGCMKHGVVFDQPSECTGMYDAWSS